MGHEEASGHTLAGLSTLHGAEATGRRLELECPGHSMSRPVSVLGGRKSSPHPRGVPGRPGGNHWQMETLGSGQVICGLGPSPRPSPSPTTTPGQWVPTRPGASLPSFRPNTGSNADLS